jgi:tmRNA-binding protein
MGHYDAAREKHEAKMLAEDAKAKGMSIEDYVAREKHENKMLRGRKLFLQRKEEDDLIEYYHTYRQG